MAECNRLGIRSDSQIREIHTSLSASYNQHVLTDSELHSFLKLRRVYDSRHCVQAFDGGNVRRAVKTGTDRHCIALPFESLTVFQVMDGMTAINFALNIGNRSSQVNVRPEIELRAVALEVCTVFFRGEKIGGL